MVDQGVIRRKLAAQVVPAVMGGADKAWPLALARAARDAMALRLEVTQFSIQRRSLTEILELPPERALIAVLEGPGEALGVLVVAPAVLSGLIEAQTMGKVTANPAPPRKPTRTDAAMIVGVFDLALLGLESALVAEDDLIWAGGFRYASFLDDPRPLGLLLEDVTYRVLHAEVSLGDGMKAGSVVLALPAAGRGRRPARPGVAASEAGAGLVFAAALGEQVMTANCQLEAVLYRMTIPLSAVIRLKTDDVVPLPMAALDQIGLEGLGGRRLAAGKLGQNRGMRAVRLTPQASSNAVPDSAPPVRVQATAPIISEGAPLMTGTG